MQKRISNVRALQITAALLKENQDPASTTHGVLNPQQVEAIEQLRSEVSKIVCGFCPSNKVAHASR
jgi:hypothetical protein